MIDQDTSVAVKVGAWKFSVMVRWLDARATASSLAIVHTGVKPNIGIPTLNIHWTKSSQGSSPAQQP